MPAWMLWHTLPFSILLSQPLCQHAWPSHSFCLRLGTHLICRFNMPLEGHISVSHLCCMLFLLSYFHIPKKICIGKLMQQDSTLHALMPMLKMTALKRKKRQNKGSCLSPVSVIINFNDAVTRPQSQLQS